MNPEFLNVTQAWIEVTAEPMEMTSTIQQIPIRKLKVDWRKSDFVDQLCHSREASYNIRHRCRPLGDGYGHGAAHSHDHSLQRGNGRVAAHYDFVIVETEGRYATRPTPIRLVIMSF